MTVVPEEGTRRATAADLARLAELAGAAVDELRQGRGGEVWARHGEIEDSVHQVLVGTVDDLVMGYAVAHTELLPDGGRLGVVTDLYTEPGIRELGVGEAMMDALVDWCREQGCFGVDSLALPGDRHTKNFFESFGLVARAIIVHRSLP
jgi:GNAT superfamily N-acetyltransferase